MKKRILAAALTLCLGAATPALAAAPSFSDVPSTHWSFSFVETAAEHGWISGYDDGSFGVNDQITYAQLATMLTRAFYDEELASYTAPSSAWYSAFCGVAADAGLFDGTYASGSAQEDSVVNQPINRYELAQIVYNVLSDQGANISFDAASVQAGISDWSAIPTNYQIAVLAANAAGVISSVDSQGTFGGSNPMTRAQAAVVMTRINEAVGTSSTPSTPVTPDDTQEPDTPVQTTGTYVGSVDSDKYHVPGCRFAEKILPGNEIWFDTAEEAQAAGYTACGVCHPG